MRKLSIIFALVFCLLFTVVLSVSAVENEPILDYEEITENDVNNEDSPIDNFLHDEPLQEPLPPYSIVDNSAVVDSINGLSESLLAQQLPDFDNMMLLNYLDLFGFEVVEQTQDFALLFFSRTNTFVLVSHDSIVNLGAF